VGAESGVPAEIVGFVGGYLGRGGIAEKAWADGAVGRAATPARSSGPLVSTLLDAVAVCRG
jgi:hypothetical protein